MLKSWCVEKKKQGTDSSARLDNIRLRYINTTTNFLLHHWKKNPNLACFSNEMIPFNIFKQNEYQTDLAEVSHEQQLLYYATHATDVKQIGHHLQTVHHTCETCNLSRFPNPIPNFCRVRTWGNKEKQESSKPCYITILSKKVICTEGKQE